MEVSVSFLKEGNYKDYINQINKSNADYIHYDVMDGKFVKNKNLSVTELCKYLDLSIKKNDIHLMVSNPDKYIEKLALYNIEYITVHYEIKNVIDYIEKINSLGIKAGIAINPETKVEEIYSLLPMVKLVLVMGVHPGKSGQKFMISTSRKISKIKEEIKRQNLNIKVSVDGGVNEEVLEEVKEADILVSASYLLDNLDKIDEIKEQE